MFGSTNRDVDVASLKNTLLVCNNKSAARKTTPLPHMPYLPFLNKASIHFKNAKAFIAHYRGAKPSLAQVIFAILVLQQVIHCIVMDL